MNGLSVDQVLFIPESQWVNIARSERDRNNIRNRCIIERGGQLKVHGFTRDSQLVLAESLGNGFGTNCSSGDYFFISVETLASFEESYAAVIQERQEIDELVELILSRDDELPSQVNNLTVEQVLPIPGWQWVNVIRRIENQYSNGTAMLEVGKSCGIQAGGELKILGFTPDNQLALAENLTGGPGTPCPAGVIFFISVEELASFEEHYAAVTQERQEIDELVELILSRSDELPSQVNNLTVEQILPIPGWQWVDVVKEIENQYSNGTAMLEVGKSCGIQAGGELKILGFTPDNQLALAENLTGGLGTPCPVGGYFLSL